MLVICYGMPRSASSYAYQLLKRLIDQAADRFADGVLEAQDFSACKNFYISSYEDFEALVSAAPDSLRRGRAVCVVKTHLGLSDVVRRNSGWIRVVVGTRDPIACARSLVESYREQMAAQGSSFLQVGSDLEKACRSVRIDLDLASSWDPVGPMRTTFEELARDPLTFVGRAARHLALDADAGQVVADVKDIWNKRETRQLPLSEAEERFLSDYFA